MFCNNCGAKIEDGAEYCGNCGQKVNINSRPTAPKTENTNRYPHAGRKNNPNKIMIIVAIAVVVAAIIAVCGFFILEYIKSAPADKVKNSSAVQQTAVPRETAEAPLEDRNSEISRNVFDMGRIGTIISQKTAPANVSVAICDCETGDFYTTYNSGNEFIASGFYLPLYVLVYEKDGANITLRETADNMMTAMDNNSANAVINSLGGLSSVNAEIRRLTYTATSFNRKFGDTEASKQGYENYTSANDAVAFLTKVYQMGAYKEMNANLKADGVVLPNIGTVYAHRGLGIGTAYNVFAVVTGAGRDYCVAIMTKDMGSSSETVKANATSLVSDLLGEINRQAQGL